MTNYTYNDPENKLTDESYNVSAATSEPAQPPVSLVYDGFGWISARVQQKCLLLVLPGRKKAAMTVPSGSFSYAYDATGRQSSVTNPFGEITSWSYLNNNWVSGEALANGGSTSYSYNAKEMVTSKVNAAPP